jgi:hypothetical protein
METRRVIAVGALSAAAVLLLGFGVLNVLYVVVPHPHQLRGLYSYLSSTYGDAILLPLTMFFFAIAIASTARTVRRCVIGGIGALLGLLSGVAVQAAWLADRTPQLNWTLIAPGDFNAAGWYHAIFLCGLCGVLSGSFAFLLAAAWEGGLSRNSLRAGALGIVMLLGFAALLFLDNTGLSTAANVATITAVCVALAAVLAITVFVAIRVSRKI